MTQSNFADIFYHVNDVTAMKTFYSDLIGWKETSFGDTAEYGYLTYQLSDTISWVIMRSPVTLPVLDTWSKGPVFQEGTGYNMNWTIRIHTLEDFQEVVARIQESTTPKFSPIPQWVGNYWSFHIRDPMGRTVDVYFEPEEKPEHTTWI